MRNIVLVAVLVLGLAAPGPAAARGALPYQLTFSGHRYSGTTPSGTISGTFGGLPVAGWYSEGKWALGAFGKRLASGTYTCIRNCTFAGYALAGRAVAFRVVSPVPTSDAPTAAANGRLSLSAFRTRGAWVSAVAQWGRRSNLPSATTTRAVADAGRI